jgi:hypothetical protein
MNRWQIFRDVSTRGNLWKLPNVDFHNIASPHLVTVPRGERRHIEIERVRFRYARFAALRPVFGVGEFASSEKTGRQRYYSNADQPSRERIHTALSGQR